MEEIECLSSKQCVELSHLHKNTASAHWHCRQQASHLCVIDYFDIAGERITFQPSVVPAAAISTRREPTIWIG